jgi:hypothetical protein
MRYDVITNHASNIYLGFFFGNTSLGKAVILLRLEVRV